MALARMIMSPARRSSTASSGTPGLHPLLPFVRQFYSTPSEYIWYDASGTAHRILQHEGGEQGDPLMPGLFAAAVAPALHQTHQALQPGEAVLAYLDDVYLLCPAARTRPLYERLQQALQQEANVSLNHGKTRIWNADGTPPPGWPEPAPNTPPIWVGDWTLTLEQQGVIVLGASIGTDEYIAAHLSAVRQDHDRLLAAIPTVPSLQAAFLILLYWRCPADQPPPPRLEPRPHGRVRPGPR